MSRQHFRRDGERDRGTMLRHRITVERKSSTDDGRGGFVESWASIGEFWAGVTPVRAAQHFEYRSVGVDATHMVRVNGSTDIRESDRIIYEGRAFEVMYSEDYQERGVVRTIMCKERR